MVARAGGCYGPPCTGYRGVTQGDPLSPTISNVVVDAVVRHWVTVVAPTKAGEEGLGETVQELTAYFYAGDGLITSPQLEMLQSLFDVITDLFNRVGLCTNLHKTVSMECRPCHAPGGFSEAAYEQWVTGIGQSYLARLRHRVQCPECGM